MTISRASLTGMVVVSWISLLLVGGAWIYYMYFEFVEDSARLREEHYAAQKDLVKNEVMKAVDLVDQIRRTSSMALEQDVESRLTDANELCRSLRKQVARSTPDMDIRIAVMKLMAAEAREVQKLYAVRGNTLYLLAPFAKWADRKDILDQVDAALAEAISGRFEISLKVPDGMESCTAMLKVQEYEAPHMRVISGACLEMAEEAIKEEVVLRLEDVTYGMDGMLFGGTMQGKSLIGPAKGRNMWSVTDVNGVKIVQEIVKAANAGGGFVHYVMPPLNGQRSAAKVSYTMPIPGWDWYVGAGAYIDDIEGTIALNRSVLKGRMISRGGIIIFGLCFLSFISFVISRQLNRKIQANLQSFTDVWNQASEKGRTINADELHYGEFRTLAAAANRMASDRQSAQDALKESLDSYSSLVSNVPGIVYHIEKRDEWVNVFFSDYALEMTGYPATEFVEGGVRTLQSIIHPDDLPWVVAALREDIKHNEPYVMDYRIIRKDGEVRWVTERGAPRVDDSGDVRWIDGVIFDASKQKAAEEEYFSHIHFLETLERVDRAMHETADMDSMLADTLDVVRRAFGSDRAWLLFPCDPDADTFSVPMESYAPEFPGAKADGVEIPLDDETRVVLREALANPGPVPFGPGSGRDLPPKSAEMFQIKSQLVFAIYPRVGKPWLMGMHQCRDARMWSDEDIRLFKEVGRRLNEALSSKLIMAELRGSEEMFRTFSEQTMLGLCVLQDDRVMFANNAFADIFDTTVEFLKKLPQKGFLKYIHPDDLVFAAEQARKKQFGDPDVVHSYKWRAVTETGRVKWVQIHSRTTPVNGKPADLISLMDINDMKRAEEDLEAVIAERTKDLALKAGELEKANAHLMKLDELKSAFLTTVSHAIRTPLTSVLGFAKLVRRDLENILESTEVLDRRHSRVVHNLSVMGDEGGRLMTLIERFLDLTALEAGDALRSEEPHGVDEAISRAADSVRGQLRGKPGVELVLDIEDGLPEMRIDPDRFGQMLGYILDNAVTFTREGTIVIRAASPDGRGLELAVEDTGKGIPDGELEAIFNVFHQVETGDTLVDDVKGEGLGLALCRMLVERLGGRVWAESDLGKGSVFRISLPGDAIS